VTAHASFQAITQKADAGVIRGVSVVTMGEAKGHNLWIDSETLAQFQKLSTGFPNGVKVKSKHGTNFDAIVGALKDFRIDGEKLLADLHLIQSHPQFSHIVELAERLPGEFGLSASFEYTKEAKDGKTFARPIWIDSVDMVDEPAANPSGLFSAKVDTSPEVMNQPDDKTILDTIKGLFCKSEAKPDVTQLSVQLSAVQTEVTTLKAQLEAKGGELSKAQTRVAELEASAAKSEAEHKAALEAKEKEVETRAAAKSLEIIAKQGVQLGAVKSDKPEDKSKAQFSELKGLAKVIAIEKAESAARAQNQ